MATTGVGFGLLGTLGGEIALGPLCALFLQVISPALLARSGARLTARVLDFCDGVFYSTALKWDQIRRGFWPIEGVVYVLHQDPLYVDRLPNYLWHGSATGTQELTPELADHLELLRNASTDHDTSICRARILGGVRGRLGLTVVRLEENHEPQFL